MARKQDTSGRAHLLGIQLAPFTAKSADQGGLMGKTLLILVALATTSGIGWGQSTAVPSENNASPNAQTEKSSNSAEGEFTKVDNQNHVLWIKTSEGKEMGFSFTEQTPIVGASGPVHVGTRLKVYYQGAPENGAETLAAVRIEVQSQPS